MSETETIVLEPEHLDALREKYPDVVGPVKSDGTTSIDMDKIVDAIDNERSPGGILENAKVTTTTMPEEHDLAVPSGGRLKIKTRKRRGGKLARTLGGNAYSSLKQGLSWMNGSGLVVTSGGGYAATSGGGYAATSGGGYAATSGGGLAKLDESYGREGFIINSQPGLGYIRKY